MFLSPTGTGLKVWFRVPADVALHPASFAAVQQHCRRQYGVEVGRACKDVCRLCFVSYDRNAFLNRDAIELAPFKPSQAPPTSSPLADRSLGKNTVTTDKPRIRAALKYVPADDRDLWLRIGFSIHSWNPTERGFGLWSEWSAQSAKFDARDQHSTWARMQNARPAAVTIGTLFGIAKDHGWQPAPPLRVKRGTVAEGYLGDGKPDDDVDVLPDAPAWPAPMHPAAFHGLAGKIVGTIEPHSESDPAAILILLLAAVGNKLYQ